MKVDDLMLMAYVDGELDIDERREIERELDDSPELAERIALFRASSLPYHAAFSQQKLPPVPEALTRAIAGLSRTHAGSATAVPPHSVRPARSARSRRQRRPRAIRRGAPAIGAGA
ncbi:anti-sigma factor family protein, partial [Paraburkholderia bengalensis]|uniref:anti-sigma factor family protein n=1 Tax=Paraburkholderia bengalensis TaxID=2747562 RepID=UPI003AF8B04F